MLLLTHQVFSHFPTHFCWRSRPSESLHLAAEDGLIWPPIRAGQTIIGIQQPGISFTASRWKVMNIHLSKTKNNGATLIAFLASNQHGMVRNGELCVVLCHEWTNAWASLTVSRSMTKGIPCSPSKGMTNPERRDEWWNLEHFLGDWISFFREVWTKGIDPWTSLIPVSFLRISANLWWSPWDAVMPHRRREDKLRFLRNLTNGNPVTSLLFLTLLVHLDWKCLTKHLNFHHSKFYFGAPCLNFSHFKGVLGIEDIVVLAACDGIAETKLWAICHHSLTVDHPYQDLPLVLSVPILNSPSRCSPFHL